MERVEQKLKEDHERDLANAKLKAEQEKELREKAEREAIKDQMKKDMLQKQREKDQEIEKERAIVAANAEAQAHELKVQ